MVGPNGETTLQAVVHGLDAGGDRVAVMAFGDEGVETLTFRDLKARSLGMAENLAADGLAPGEPVVLFAPNSPRWVVARLALIAADALCVPVADDADAATLHAQLADSGAARLFTTAELLPTAREAVADLTDPPAIHGLDALPDGPAGDPAPLPRAAPDAPVALFYTSGTTGPPKAVPLTHANILTNLKILHDLGLIGPDDRVCLPLPLHHAYPFIVGLMLPLAAGAGVVLPAGVTGPELVHALGHGRASAMVGVPRLYDALVAGLADRARARGRAGRVAFDGLLGLSGLLHRRFGVRAGRWLLRPVHRAFAPHLRLLASGGARLEAATARRLAALGYEVLTGYGLVETTSIATFNRPGAARFGTAGRPGPATGMRLRSVEGLDHPEIQFRGPIVFDGYRNNPAANAEAFTADGWFRTGDLGRLDADGFLVIAGRVKETIVTPGGKNITPEAVEAVYAQSPFVREIAVLQHEDRLVALVVPDMDAVRAHGAGSPADPVRVDLQRLGAGLPGYQRLADFALTRDALPRNQLGKYRRHALPALYEQARYGTGGRRAGTLSAADAERLQGDRARALMAWLRERFPGAPLDPDASLQMDLGIDSLAWVNLALDLERRLGVGLDEGAVARLVTVRDLVDAVEAAPAAGGAARAAPDADRWLAPRGPAALAAGRGLHAAARLLARAVFRLRVRGRAHLPRDGPVILAANHASDLDPLVLGAALPWRVARRAWWGADARRVFGRRPGRLLARVVPLFPVDDRTPAASLDAAARVLERGGMLLWFPEEWRSPTGELQPFRPGIGNLLRRTGAPVVPVHIDGTFEAMPRTARLPRPRPVTVTFGAPVAAEAVVAGDDQTTADRVQDHFVEVPPC